MREFTRQAFERAVVFHALYLDPDRPTWADKAAALRAAGQRPASKSKRRAGRVALTPDQLMVAFGNQRGRCKRVELFAAVFAVFGIRPAELARGVRLEVMPDGLRLHVAGAKVDAVRGQPQRVLSVAPTRLGLSKMAVGLLTLAAAQDGGRLQPAPPISLPCVAPCVRRNRACHPMRIAMPAPATRKRRKGAKVSRHGWATRMTERNNTTAMREAGAALSR